jgi:excisionase family DNA binding protein
MTERLMTAQEVAEHLGVPVATLYQWRYRGEGPRALRVGRHLRYVRADLDAWVTAQIHSGERRTA